MSQNYEKHSNFKTVPTT